MKIKEYLLEKVSFRMFFLGIILICLLIALFLSFKQSERINAYQGVLEHYLDTYIYKQVSIKGAGRFNVLSVDGGKNWYTYEIKDNGGIRITGTFEEKVLRAPIN